jgi:fructosamine-3-kinase
MKSNTKAVFSKETIKQLVESQFGFDTRISKITPLRNGWFNTAYEIQFADEEPAAVLRIAPDPKQRLLTYEKEMMKKELLVYKTIASAKESSDLVLPIPKLLGADTSRSVLDRDFMFIEKYSGHTLDELIESISDNDLPAIQHQIGTIMGALHTIKNDAFGYFGDGPGCGSKTWREAFSAFWGALLEDGETLGVRLPFSYSKIWGLFEQYAPLLEEIDQPALVHWDLWPVNIFIIEVNGKYVVEGITDWERAYWGDPESEPALATQHYGSAFFRGYGQPLTKSQNAAIRHKLYQIYLLLVMKIEAKVRFEDAEHLTWVETELTKELINLDQI